MALLRIPILIIVASALALFLAMQIDPRIDPSPMFNIGWGVVSVGLVSALILTWLKYGHHQDAIGSKMSALTGAAWELISLMENSTPGGPESRAVKAEATMEKIAIAGSERVVARPLAVVRQLDPRLTEAGLKLVEDYKSSSAGFRKSRGAVRQGVRIFLAIIRDRNLQAAYILMVEHMRAQLEDRSLPNFPNLKLFLDIPIDWPDRDMIDRLGGQGYYGYMTSSAALQRLGQAIFDGLEYKTFDPRGLGALTVTGQDIIVAMREFTRSDDTRGAFP